MSFPDEDAWIDRMPAPITRGRIEVRGGEWLIGPNPGPYVTYVTISGEDIPSYVTYGGESMAALPVPWWVRALEALGWRQRCRTFVLPPREP